MIVGVLGAGTMGAGIAEVLARAGLEVVGVEPTAGGLERAAGHLSASTGRAVARGKLTQEQADEALGRIRLHLLADRLNDTPRRCLGDRTPREVFEHHLAAPTGPP